MSGTSVSQIAYYLALIGGILMVLFGLLGLLVDFGGFYFHWGFAYGGIVTLVMGILRSLEQEASTPSYGLLC